MKKRFFALCLVLVMVAALCACSGGTAGESKDNPKGTAQEQEDRTPVYGGSVTVGITQDMDSLDPHKAVAAGTKEVLYNIFEGLVKSDENGDLVPAVAKSASVSEDGLVYSFEMRDGVKFHDGREVTANDIVYSIKRVAGLLEASDPEVQVTPAFSVISNVLAKDKVIEVQLSEPNTELMGFFTCAIIPEGYENQSSAPIGTGPFRFVSYIPQVGIEMKKNDEYYIEGVPYLDSVSFKIASNLDSAFVEFLGGAIDILPYITAEQAAQLSDGNRYVSAPTNMIQVLFLNNGVAPFDDINVRRALSMAVDRQMIVDMVLGGKGAPVWSAIYNSYTTYYNSELENYYANDLEAARALLAEAGYSSGFTFTIRVPSNYSVHVNTAQIIAEQLKSIGVTAKIELVEWSTWLSDVYAGRDFEATIIALDSKLAPSDTLRFYPSTSSKNLINYSNSSFDSLYADALSTVDTAEKAKKYKELQQILTDDAASVFLESPHNIVALNANTFGYVFYPMYVQDMSTVYTTKK